MDEKIARECPARSLCQLHGKNCSTACPLYIDIHYQLQLAGIKKRFSKYTVDSLPKDMLNLPLIQKWSKDIIKRVEFGHGLYFFGTVGTGKTTVASAVLMTYIIEKSKDSLRKGERTRQLVAYANVPDLLDMLRRGFDDPEIAAQGAKKLSQLASVPLVLLDDIGAERPSEWARERLLTLIGSRYDNELSTLFTSNLTIGELGEPLGARLQSRIEGMTGLMQFYGIDHRKKK